MRWLLIWMSLILGVVGLCAQEDTEAEVSAAQEALLNETNETPRQWVKPPPPIPEDGIADVLLIPVHGPIGKTQEYVMRRAIKQAIDSGAEVLLLDMDTPGGRADIMLEMMEMLDRFEGHTIVFVNTEATSAGAVISMAADDIFMAPRSVIGSAGIITSTGQDLGETLRQKLNSYMDAKVRAINNERPRRADVLRAMMVSEYVLELDGKVISPEGNLLMLTAEEAFELYGDPPIPLLASGIHQDVASLLEAEYGQQYTLSRLEVTWSEEVAMFMEKITPILLGLGFLLLMLEFYSPGFGAMGITGLCLLGVVFLSNYVAGLAGYEPLIFFVIGFALIMVELLLIPGVMFLAITGVILMLGALLWSLSDVWPKTDSPGFDIDMANVLGAMGDIAFGLLITIFFFALLYRFLPRSWLWNKLVLQKTSGGAPAYEKIASSGAAGSTMPAIGARGIAVTHLRPSGRIEVGNVQYEATLVGGWADRGDTVVITGYNNFHLLVDKLES